MTEPIMYHIVSNLFFSDNERIIYKKEIIRKENIGYIVVVLPFEFEHYKYISSEDVLLDYGSKRYSSYKEHFLKNVEFIDKTTKSNSSETNNILIVCKDYKRTMEFLVYYLITYYGNEFPNVESALSLILSKINYTSKTNYKKELKIIVEELSNVMVKKTLDTVTTLLEKKEETTEENTETKTEEKTEENVEIKTEEKTENKTEIKTEVENDITIEEKAYKIFQGRVKDFSVSKKDMFIDSIKIDGYYNTLPDLSMFKKLKYFAAVKIGLTSLPALPDSIEFLNVSRNQLTSLPDLPSSVDVVCCDFNNIKVLEKYPPNLRAIYLDNNKLESLPYYDEEKHKSGKQLIVRVANNNLTFLPNKLCKHNVVLFHGNPVYKVVTPVGCKDSEEYFRQLDENIEDLNKLRELYLKLKSKFNLVKDTSFPEDATLLDFMKRWN